jgi:hypothetical protein
MVLRTLYEIVMRGSFRCPSPASLFIYVENVDEVVDKVTKVGGASQGP